jgi:hypothetical protein
MMQDFDQSLSVLGDLAYLRGVVAQYREGIAVEARVEERRFVYRGREWAWQCLSRMFYRDGCHDFDNRRRWGF